MSHFGSKGHGRRKRYRQEEQMVKNERVIQAAEKLIDQLCSSWSGEILATSKQLGLRQRQQFREAAFTLIYETLTQHEKLNA